MAERRDARSWKHGFAGTTAEGFFCVTPLFRAAMDWAVEQARARTPLIGGFHSPLEQFVLEVMLAAHAPVVIVIARKLETGAWHLVWHNGQVRGVV